MFIGLPQAIFLVLTLVGIGTVTANHGKYKTGKFNIWATLFTEVIIYALLIWGGFFD